jgi:hypothetical protein
VVRAKVCGIYFIDGITLTATTASPPPDTYNNFDNMPYKQNPTNGPGALKSGRAPPPRVDTSAASMLYNSR